jgi:hypothetical protein
LVWQIVPVVLVAKEVGIFVKCAGEGASRTTPDIAPGRFSVPKGGDEDDATSLDGYVFYVTVIVTDGIRIGS